MAGRPRGSGGQARELTPEEIRRIDKCLADSPHELRNRALLYLGLGSGLRISELVSLTIAAVAPHGDVLMQIVIEKHSTKSKRSRTVHISRQAAAHLETYLQSHDQRKQLNAPLFPSAKCPGAALLPNSAVLLLKRMFEAAAVSGASSHSLRHTHANALRRAGADLKIIQQQLGHTSLATTERYFRVDPLEIERAVGRLRF